MEALNRLILHPDFEKIFKELSDKNIFIPSIGDQNTPHDNYFPTSGQIISNLEEIKGYSLDIKRGCEVTNKFLYSAYDESIMKFMALEGSAFFTAHSLVIIDNKEYIPVVFVSFNFYTRSKDIISKSSYIKYAIEPEIEFKRDYMKDRLHFLLKYSPPRSLLFIDGPLIGGDLYTISVDNNSKYLAKEIIPIYFVKNSISNIVTDNITGLKGKYNSDMHWVHTVLKPGERSCFFKYEDQVNKKNSKIFCYLKAFDSGPQRIEMHEDTYSKYLESMDDILGMILYLMYVNGIKTNAQIRPIIIAENYAREMLAFIDIHKYFKEINITPTLNQMRFGG
jgi:hypothetical protein